MRRESSGRYLEIVAGGETVRAFVPDPLPPVPPLELTGARQTALEQATMALGRLDGLSLLLPDPKLLLYAYVRREAVLSSQIEGTQSSLSDLLLYEINEAPGAPVDDVVETSNYVAAMEHAMARMQGGFPFSNRLLRESHALLMASGRGSERAPGEFRRSQNWIGGRRPSKAHFVPPPPQEVQNCMADLERFIHNQKQELPVLIKAALVHVQFETIHPFLDGNGRLGRLLIALLLHEGGILSQPLLYLSLYFKENRATYYELLSRVRSEGDWEAWVDFFLEGVRETASGAVRTAQQIVELFERDTARIHQLGRSSANALRIHEVLRQKPVCTVAHMVKVLSVTFPTASKAMSSLVELGIARELTGRRRDRIFAYDAYLGTLSEGGEPLRG